MYEKASWCIEDLCHYNSRLSHRVVSSLRPHKEGHHSRHTEPLEVICARSLVLWFFRECHYINSPVKAPVFSLVGDKGRDSVEIHCSRKLPCFHLRYGGGGNLSHLSMTSFVFSLARTQRDSWLLSECRSALNCLNFSTNSNPFCVVTYLIGL